MLFVHLFIQNVHTAVVSFAWLLKKPQWKYFFIIEKLFLMGHRIQSTFSSTSISANSVPAKIPFH